MSLLKGFFSLNDDTNKAVSNPLANDEGVVSDCLLYTSDAADE